MLLTDLLDEDNLGAVVSFITTIVVSTLFIELCGAVLLYFSWEGKDINLMGEPCGGIPCSTPFPPSAMLVFQLSR